MATGRIYEKSAMLAHRWGTFRAIGQIILTESLLTIGGMVLSDTFSKREVASIDIRPGVGLGSNLVVRLVNGRVKRFFWGDVPALAEALRASGWPVHER